MVLVACLATWCGCSTPTLTPPLTHNPIHYQPPQALQAIRAMTNCLDVHARGAAPLLLPALPQLCQRLRAVDDLDLAEQCMRWCVALRSWAVW